MLELRTLSIEQPGIYDLPEDEYHGTEIWPAPMLSNSIIKCMLDSPRRAWVNHPALNPAYERKVSAEFDIGIAAHALLLEGSDRMELIEAENYRKADAQNARDEARANGRVPVLPHQKRAVLAMVEAAQVALTECDDLHILDLQVEGVSEQSFVWEEDGLWIKARPDWMPHDNSYMMDYKTISTSANPRTIGRYISDRRYEVQDALYRRGGRELLGKELPFVFMFQEVEPPHLCSFVSLPAEFRAIGESEVQRGMKLFRECLQSDKWPGYPTTIYEPDPPPWKLAELMHDEVMEAEGSS